MRPAHHEKDRLRRSEQYHFLAAAAYQERGLDRGAVGRQVVNWQHTLEQRWTSVGFGEMNVTSDGRQILFEVQVFHNDLDSAVVQGEGYVVAITGGDTVRREMAHVRRPAGTAGDYV